MGTQRVAMVVLGPNDEREDRGRHVDIDYAKATTQTNYAKLRARATVLNSYVSGKIGVLTRFCRN